MTKKVFLASDHAGFELKEALLPFLREHGYEPEDLGPFTNDPNDDYTDTVFPVGLRVVEQKGSMGIVIGGSGQGEAIIVNRLHGVRAAVFYGGTKEIITLSRQHNDANVLSLGARFIDQETAKEAVLLWLQTEFSKEERHVRRVQKLG